MTQRPSTRMGWRASESHGMDFLAAIETGATRYVVRTSDRHVARVAGCDWSHAKGSAAERLARCRLTRHTQDEESDDGHENTNETSRLDQGLPAVRWPEQKGPRVAHD